MERKIQTAKLQLTTNGYLKMPIEVIAIMAILKAKLTEPHCVLSLVSSYLMLSHTAVKFKSVTLLSQLFVHG